MTEPDANLILYTPPGYLFDLVLASYVKRDAWRERRLL
jgi:hypothetical protein